MARTRFVSDTGLTVRMTTVLFLLGALFVALVVGMMFSFPNYAGPRPPRHRHRHLSVVELRQDRAAADACPWSLRRKPGAARHDRPAVRTRRHAQAAGGDRRHPLAERLRHRTLAQPVRGLRDDRILHTLNAEELEAVLAHELVHVAHRDVLVMTVASSAGIIAGMATRGAQFGVSPATAARAGRSVRLVLVISLVVYAVSFLLMRLLSRYRELCADRSGAYLTQKPSALASALTKISGQMNAVPERDLRATPKTMNAFFITPAVRGLGWGR